MACEGSSVSGLKCHLKAFSTLPPTAHSAQIFGDMSITVVFVDFSRVAVEMV